MIFVTDNLQVDDDTLRCRGCARPLGPAASGYRALAGTFDLPLSVGQSTMIAPATSTYLLRHYACPGCGSLFEVEMLAAADAGTGGGEP